MRVNIDGRGAFAGIGTLPARGVELSEEEILRLTNFKNIRVYDAATGVYISKKSIMDMRQKRAEEAKKAAEAAKVAAKKPEPVVEVAPVVEEIPDPVVQEPLPEVPNEAYVEPTVELEPAVEETPVEEVEETVAEEAAPVEEKAEEVVEEKTDDRPYRNKKKGKKNRNYTNDAE